MLKAYTSGDDEKITVSIDAWRGESHHELQRIGIEDDSGNANELSRDTN